MFEFGCASGDITPKTDGVGMLGWGRFGTNTVHGVATPIKSRAFVFKSKNTGKKIAFVVAEITFITISVKQGVIKRLEKEFPELGFHDDNVMISATHTHSVPGGYSHYLMYNITTPGYVDEVCQKYIDGIVESIIEANRRLKSCNLFLSCGEIPAEQKVAFNRSLEAYNENVEITKKFLPDENHLAVDREMTLLRMDSESGFPLGMINWFAVHCTSIHSDNFLISPDNKGYASIDFEKYARNKYSNSDFTGGFAQSACGDVSPNFQYFPQMKYCRGESEDDYESAKINGKIQSDHAVKLFESPEKQKITPEIDYFHMYVDFSNVKIASRFSEGKKDQTTGQAILGLSMLLGTAEGPGITKKTGSALEILSNTISFKDKLFSTFKRDFKRLLDERKDIHGNKIILVESGERKMLGTSDLKNLILPDWTDPVISHLRELGLKDATGNQPWTPNILPLQIFIIGEFAIIGIPSEVTTMSSKRIRDMLLPILSKRGVDKIVISAYSNGYAGYITTKEEYEVQLYEGGSTHFGKWTLGAYQTKLEYIAEQLIKRPEERDKKSSLEPHRFNKEELSRRSFQENYRRKSSILRSIVKKK